MEKTSLGEIGAPLAKKRQSPCQVKQRLAQLDSGQSRQRYSY